MSYTPEDPTVPDFLTNFQVVEDPRQKAEVVA